MKNLKKIFIVLALIALLVSSVAIIALAEEGEEYTGTLAEAKELFDKAQKETELSDQAKALAELYAYLSEKLVNPSEEGYDAFVEEYNAFSFGILLAMSDNVFLSTESGSYSSYMNALEKVAEFEKIPSITYSPISSTLYTGDLSVVEAKLATVNSSTDYQTMLARMSEVYLYLVANPVNPATDAYLDFINDYSAKADLLAEKFEEAVNAAVTPEAKLQIMVAFRRTLAGVADNPETSDVNEFVAAAPISKGVVEAFNNVRDAVVSEYTFVKDEVANVDSLEDLASPVFVTDLAEFEALLGALEAEAVKENGAKDFAAFNAAASAASAYLAQNNIDPAVEGLAAVATRYNTAITAHSDYCEYLIDLESGIEGKVEKLAVWYNSLKDCPYSENAVSKYNAARSELAALCQDFIGALEGYEIPVYVAPTDKKVNATVASLNYALADVVAAYNTYASADSEDKAAALEDVKSAMAVMYRYLDAAIIDRTAEGYDSFASAYDALKTDFVSALLAPVDTAENADAKEVALAGVKAYLEKNPISKAAVDAYNAKVDEVLSADEAKAAEYKLGSVYYEIEELVEVIETSPDRTARYAAFNLLYTYTLKKYDVTDSAYDAFVASYNSAVDIIESDIAAYLTAADTIAERRESVATVYTLLATTPFSETAIGTLETVIDSNIEYFSGALANINGELPTAPALVNVYDVLFNLVEEYRKAEGIEEQSNAFKALYNKIAEVDGAFIKSVDTSYASFTAAYAEVSESFANSTKVYLDEKMAGSLVQQLEVLQGVNAYLTQVEFSQSVIDLYNQKLTATKSTEFDALVNNVNASVPALTYTAPDAFNSDLAELRGLVDAAKTTDDKAAAYKAAYDHIIAVTIAYDFTDLEAYVQLVVDFNAVKSEVVDLYTATIGDAEDVEGKKTALSVFYDYIATLQGTASSVAVVDAYNNARAALLKEVKGAASAELNIYSESVLAIEAQYKACPVGKPLLPSADKKVYDNFMVKLNAMRYALIDGYIFDYENTSGALSIFAKKSAVSKIENYKAQYSLDSLYNDKSLAEVLYKEAFVAILNEIDTIEDETEKTTAIADMKTYLEGAYFPTALVNEFKTRFTITDDIQTQQSATPTGTGTVAEFFKLILAFNKAETLADMKTSFLPIINYVSTTPLSEVSSYDVVNDKIKDIIEAMSGVTEEYKAQAELKTPLSEYSLGYVKNNKGKDINFDYETTGGLYFTRGEIVKSANGSYQKYTDVPDKATYGQIKDLVISGSFVVELDVMCEDSLTVDFKFIDDSVEFGSSVRVTTHVVQFNENRLLYGSEDSTKGVAIEDYPNYVNGKDDPIYISPGQWMHITCVFDVDKMEQELLIDYVSLGRRPLVAAGTNQAATHPFKTFRLNEKADPLTTTVCYDNLRIYSGSSYRTMGKLDNLTDAEKFKLYVDCFTNEENSMADRIFAYNEAASLAGKVASLVPESYVERFRAFDYEQDIHIPAQEIYLSYLEGEIAKIEETGIDSSNLAQKQTILNSIDSYLAANGDHIIKSAERFVAIKDKIDFLKSEAVRIDNLSNLIDAFKLFGRATTSISMQKYFDRAAVYYDLCGFENADNYESAMRDPMCAFLAELDEKYNSIEEYYTAYMPDCINAQVKLENSQKIIDCIGFIETVATGKDTLGQAEYHALLKTKALENADFVNTYIVVIRSIVDNDNYNADYEGVDEALIIYNLLNKDFYDILMNAHYAVIKEQLDKYPLTESYIGRAGICTYVENYIVKNNVDMNSEIGRQYLHTLTVYKAELDVYKDDYAAVLEANTVAFIGIVNKMSSYAEYKDLKPLYDEAIAKYYYNMNVDAPATQAAIAQFDAYEAKIKSIEENSAMFIGYVKNLSTATRKSHVYRALVNCGKHVDGVDEGVEGVSAALATYEKKLADYNAEIGAINQDVSNAVGLVCSVRSNSIAATVLAIIKSLFSK